MTNTLVFSEKPRFHNEAAVLLKVCRLKDKQRTWAMQKHYKAIWALQEILNDIEQRKAHIIFKYHAKRNFYS